MNYLEIYLIFFCLGVGTVIVFYIIIRKSIHGSSSRKKKLKWLSEVGWISFGLFGVFLTILKFVSSNQESKIDSTIASINTSAQIIPQVNVALIPSKKDQLLFIQVKKDSLNRLLNNYKKQTEKIRSLDHMNSSKKLQHAFVESINIEAQILFNDQKRAALENLISAWEILNKRKDIIHYSQIVKLKKERKPIDFLKIEIDSSLNYPYFRYGKENKNLGMSSGIMLEAELYDFQKGLNHLIETYNNLIKQYLNTIPININFYFYLIGVAFGFRFVKVIIEYPFLNVLKRNNDFNNSTIKNENIQSTTFTCNQPTKKGNPCKNKVKSINIKCYLHE